MGVLPPFPLPPPFLPPFGDLPLLPFSALANPLEVQTEALPFHLAAEARDLLILVSGLFF